MHFEEMLSAFDGAYHSEVTFPALLTFYTGLEVTCVRVWGHGGSWVDTIVAARLSYHPSESQQSICPSQPVVWLMILQPVVI